MVMWILVQDSGHRNWNHSPCEKYVPHPQLPEASETTMAPGLAFIGTAIMLTPFHLGRKTPTIEGLSETRSSSQGDGGVLLQMSTG